MRGIISLVTALLALWEALGEQPRSYAEGETVDLKVNKMTSEKALFPLDYYSLPFCQPEGGPEVDKGNMGQLLAGDRIQSSPYRLKMKVDMYCEQLCIADLGRGEGADPNDTVDAIRRQYHHNWIVDNIPSAKKLEDETTIHTSYWGGFPLGFVADHLEKVFIHNHVNIEIQYRDVETEPGKSRIVRFIVQPLSIKHEFEDDPRSIHGDGAPFKVAKITNPIMSGINKIASDHGVHTSYDNVVMTGHMAQPASGKVLFTYDVIWKENEGIDWPSRWDIYMTMDNAVPSKVHWFSTLNNLVVLYLLSAMITFLLVRNLRRDFNSYKRFVTDEEKAESIIEFGWKLVHRDVFRPPRFSPFLLSVCCGAGAQLLCTAFWTILISVSGLLHSSMRGSLIIAQTMLFVINGLVAGYVTARFYKTFKGRSWQKAAALSAFGFPGISFGLWLILNSMPLWQKSTYAVPMATIVRALFFWFLISTPLVFFGSSLGYKQNAIEFPMATSNAPRRIPPQSLSLRLALSVGSAGILQFGVCFIQFYYIFSSMWASLYYHSFGFLLVAFITLVAVCSETAILFCYLQLHGEDYHWWWRSFIVGGSFGVVTFIYSFVFNSRIRSSSFSTSVLYFGVMGLLSFGLFLMSGFVGMSACLWFNRRMFASIVTGSTNANSASDSLCSTDQHAKSTTGRLEGHMPLKAGSDVPPTSELVLNSALDLQTKDNQCRHMIKKAIVSFFLLAVLISPMLFRPSHSLGPYRVRERQSDPILGELEPGWKVHKTSIAYRFGLEIALDYLDCPIAFAALFWMTIVTLSVVIKRRSARPGGMIYMYNQRRVHNIMSKRKRLLCAILEDPILLHDMKARYGDLTSLLCVVAKWQSHGFEQKKDECVKTGKTVVVPWIRAMNGCMFVIIPISCYLIFDEFLILSMMILSMVFVHILDNLVLYRAAAGKVAPRMAEREGLFAAVGIPVIGSV